MAAGKRKFDQIENLTDGDPDTLQLVRQTTGPLKKICGVRGIGGIDCSIVENTLLIDGNGAPGVIEINASNGIVCTPDPITGVGSVGVTNMEVDGFTGQTAYNTGDTLYADGPNSLTRRAIGNEDDIYKVVGGVPTWAPNPADGVTSIAAADSSITLTPDPIVSTGTIAVTNPLPVPTVAGSELTADGTPAATWSPPLTFVYDLQVNAGDSPAPGIAYVSTLSGYDTIYFNRHDANTADNYPAVINMVNFTGPTAVGADKSNIAMMCHTPGLTCAVVDIGVPTYTLDIFALSSLTGTPLTEGLMRVSFAASPFLLNVGTMRSLTAGTGLTSFPASPLTVSGVILLADIATDRLMGNTSGISAPPSALTGTEATALLDTFSTSSTTKGLVIGSNGVSTDNFLRADNTWATPPGGGTVDSITAGTGITCAPNPIVDSGTISVTNPLPPPGTGAAGYSLVLDSIPSAGWEKPLSYVFNLSVNASTLPPGGNVYIPSLVSNYVMYFPASDLNTLTTGEVFTNMAAWQSAGGSGYSNMTMIFQQGTGLSGSSYAYTGQVASTGFGCWSFTSPFAFPNTLLTDIIRVMLLPNPKLNPDIANNTVMGNVSGGSAEAIPLTAAQATGVLDSFAGSIKGLVPTGSGGSSSVFLRGDGTWDTPPGTYTPPAVNNNTLMGNNSGGSAAPSALTGTQATALLDTFSTSSTTKGLVSGSNGVGSTYFLNANNAWAVPPAGGTSSRLLTAYVANKGEGGTDVWAVFTTTEEELRSGTFSGASTATTITPHTTVWSGPFSIGLTTGVRLLATSAFSSSTVNSGTLTLNLAYVPALPTTSTSSTLLSTCTISYTAIADWTTTKFLTGVTWSPTSFTLPARSVLLLSFTNGFDQAGSGTTSMYVAVDQT